MKKWGNFSIYHVSPDTWSLKCQKRLIFVFSAENSKKSVTICTKYLTAFGRSNLALLENAVDYLLGSELPLRRCQPFNVNWYFFF